MNKEQDLNRIREEVAALDDQRLKQEWEAGLRLTQQALMRSVSVYQELKKRNLPVTGDRMMVRFIEQLSRDEMAIDIAMRFAARPRVMDRLLNMPPERREERRQILNLPDEEVVAAIQPKHRPQPPAPDHLDSVVLTGEFVKIVISGNEFLLPKREARKLQKNLRSLLRTMQSQIG